MPLLNTISVKMCGFIAKGLLALERMKWALFPVHKVQLLTLFEGKATPSNDEIRKAIASELKSDESLVVVKHIYTSFGSPEAVIEAYVYTTKEDMERIEPKTKKDKEKKPEGEAGAEKPAEAAPAKPEEKKEEAPKAEEKKEEKPAEKKEEAPAPEAKEEKKAEEKKKEKAE